MPDRSTPPLTGNWNLLGHEWAVDLLSAHVARNTARHAYLLAGPPGLGRRTLALRFAQALNCPQPAAPGQPCGTCRDCKQIAAMQHPDLAIVQAESEGGTLKVEQVRAVQHAFSLKPYQARYRVAIFARFQEANDSAANALLKTLEEAPAHAVLILTADSPEALLPTIVSRCEVLRLRPLQLELLQAHLKSSGLPDDRARLLAHISGGRPGLALRLLQDEKLLAERAARLDELQALLPASRVDKFSYAEQLGKDRDAMRQTILLWLSYWRDVLLQTAGAQMPLANVDRAAEIQALAARLDLSRVRRVVADLESALGRLERNVNPRLLAEVLLLDWPRD
jgi:DNA polymerase-3 subunit delta'